MKHSPDPGREEETGREEEEARRKKSLASGTLGIDPALEIFMRRDSCKGP